MHKVKTQRSEELFVKNMFIFYTVIIKNYKVKKIVVTNFRKDWNKFPEISRNFPSEISELTTLIIIVIIIIIIVAIIIPIPITTPTTTLCFKKAWYRTFAITLPILTDFIFFRS